MKEEAKNLFEKIDAEFKKIENPFNGEPDGIDATVDCLIVSESLVPILEGEPLCFDKCHNGQIIRYCGGNYIGTLWCAQVYKSNKLREGEFLCISRDFERIV